MDRFKKGDKVIVITGKDKGKTGVVNKVIPQSHSLIVEKLNVITKHTKRSEESEGGIVKTSAPMDWSNVRLLCPKTEKPTSVGFKVIDGKKVRIAKISGEVI